MSSSAWAGLDMQLSDLVVLKHCRFPIHLGNIQNFL